MSTWLGGFADILARLFGQSFVAHLTWLLSSFANIGARLNDFASWVVKVRKMWGVLAFTLFCLAWKVAFFALGQIHDLMARFAAMDVLDGEGLPSVPAIFVAAAAFVNYYVPLAEAVASAIVLCQLWLGAVVFRMVKSCLPVGG